MLSSSYHVGSGDQMEVVCVGGSTFTRCAPKTEAFWELPWLLLAGNISLPFSLVMEGLFQKYPHNTK